MAYNHYLSCQGGMSADMLKQGRFESKSHQVNLPQTMLPIFVQSANPHIEVMVQQPINRFVLIEHADKLYDGGNARCFEKLANEAQLREFQENPFVCLLI